MENQQSKLTILTRPNGSALYSHGKTTLTAGVYGPTECKPQKLLIDKACIEMHYRPKSGLPTVGDRLYESIFKNICQTVLYTVLYPRAAVVIVIQEMQSEGELIASAVNACCLALMDSGIDMKFLVAGVSCCLDENEELQMSPTPLQMSNAKATFIFVFDSIHSSIIASYTTGSFSIENYTQAMEMCKSESANVFLHYREVLKSKFSM